MAITDTLIGNVKGKKGDAGEITDVTASVANNVGTPSCNVTLGGTPSERTINLAFSGLKGEKGDTGSVTTGGTIGDFHVVGDLDIDGYMNVDDGAHINGGLAVDSLKINNKKPFVEYVEASTPRWTTAKTGRAITLGSGFNFHNLNTIIQNNGLPILKLNDTEGSDGTLILKLYQITTNGMMFQGTYAMYNASHQYYILINSNNAISFYHDYIDTQPYTG